jgi:hypothetical protein
MSIVPRQQQIPRETTDDCIMSFIMVSALIVLTFALPKIV